MGTEGSKATSSTGVDYFDGLHEDLLRLIAQLVPLDVPNLNQLNISARRLELSEHQPLVAWTELSDLKHLKQCVDTSMPHLLRKMQTRLLCCK